MKRQELQEQAIIQSIESRYKANNVPFAVAFEEAYTNAIKKKPNAAIEIICALVVDLLWEYLEEFLQKRNKTAKKLPKWLKWLLNIILLKTQTYGDRKEEQ